MTGPRRPVLISTDLDRTLIFSLRASAALGGALPASRVEDTGRDSDAELCHAAADSLAALPAHVMVCPATSRNLARFGRLRLPFRARYAVAANGGVVLADSAHDPQWAARTARLLAGAASAAQVRPVLAGERDRGAAAAAPPWLVRTGEPDDMCCLAIVDVIRLPADELTAIASRCADLGWKASLTGRKLQAFPAGFGKEHAVDFVAQRVERDTGTPPVRLTAGDTEHDRAMLAAADLAWVPARSELACALAAGRARPDHVIITAEPGHAAAAQITADWRQVSEISHECGPVTHPDHELRHR